MNDNNVNILEAPNINRGKPYQDRVCIICKKDPSKMSNYCRPCYGLFKTSLLEWVEKTTNGEIE